MTEEKKVKKSAAVKRPKFADEKYLGTEPEVNENSTQIELARAYNWFNYFYTSDDAKAFTISYLKSGQTAKASTAQRLPALPVTQLRSWISYCEILA